MMTEGGAAGKLWKAEAEAEVDMNGCPQKGLRIGHLRPSRVDARAGERVGGGGAVDGRLR